jgi:hypothetical protein
MEHLLRRSQGDRACVDKQLATTRETYTAIIEEILTLTSTR